MSRILFKGMACEHKCIREYGIITGFSDYMDRMPYFKAYIASMV